MSEPGGSVPSGLFRLLMRLRLPALFVGVIGLGTAILDIIVLDLSGQLVSVAGLIGVIGLSIGVGATVVPLRPEGEVRTVAAPVVGRWTGLHSPVRAVPSHGTHGYGQTFAIDLIHRPEGVEAPTFGEGPSFRRPEDFPAFGQPIVAPAAGEVVRVHDRARDHRSRSSWPAFVLMLLEAMVREAAGSKAMLGNHVVIDLGDEVYAALAHLQRGSVQVAPGDRVQQGQLLARCGNSGNSGEPHLHVQLMDHPRASIAAGLPMAFSHVSGLDDEVGLPDDEQAIEGRPPGWTER